MEHVAVLPPDRVYCPGLLALSQQGTVHTPASRAGHARTLPLAPGKVVGRVPTESRPVWARGQAVPSSPSGPSESVLGGHQPQVRRPSSHGQVARPGPLCLESVYRAGGSLVSAEAKSRGAEKGLRGQ